MLVVERQVAEQPPGAEKLKADEPATMAPNRSQSAAPAGAAYQLPHQEAGGGSFVPIDRYVQREHDALPSWDGDDRAPWTKRSISSHVTSLVYRFR